MFNEMPTRALLATLALVILALGRNFVKKMKPVGVWIMNRTPWMGWCETAYPSRTKARLGR